jgi:NADH:quinone reductase (non-electrogenic)
VTQAQPQVLIAGGGYIGVYTALSLRKRRRDVRITLVSPESYMTYQAFLPEAAGGNIEPRHVVVPLRKALKGVRLITGELAKLDHERRTATVAPVEGEAYEIAYDHVVIGVGSVSRLLPVPGLAEHGIGFKTIEEATYLRNQVLARMDAAESTLDESVRRRALSFVFVGAGYAGVEALAELEDMARAACRYFPSITRSDMRWVLVEATGRILPEIGDDLADYALRRLRARDIEVFLETRLESATDGIMKLSDGEEFEAETLVWTAGVRAHPSVSRFGFSTDEHGRIVVDDKLRIQGATDAWSAGDCAAVPDLTTGGTSPPTAQHALRQARRIGRNIAAVLGGEEPETFRYKNLGALASLGRYKGVAMVLGIKLRGFPAWFLHRTYHLSRIPTFGRKVRVMMDWTVGLFFRRDIVQLGSLVHPRDAIAEAGASGEGRTGS